VRLVHLRTIPPDKVYGQRQGTANCAPDRQRCQTGTLQPSCTELPTHSLYVSAIRYSQPLIPGASHPAGQRFGVFVRVHRCPGILSRVHRLITGVPGCSASAHGAGSSPPQSRQRGGPDSAPWTSWPAATVKSQSSTCDHAPHATLPANSVMARSWIIQVGRLLAHSHERAEGLRAEPCEQVVDSGPRFQSPRTSQGMI
jgi:hypothetical protein